MGSKLCLELLAADKEGQEQAMTDGQGLGPSFLRKVGGHRDICLAS